MTIKVNEIFKSIQGEGQFQGTPAVFVRLSGCNRECPWCDSQYHKKGRRITTAKLRGRIGRALAMEDDYFPKCIQTVVWTGGEPLLQIEAVGRVIEKMPGWITHHLETNGDLIANEQISLKDLDFYFDYISCSPKDVETAEKILEKDKGICVVDTKIVTDLETVGNDLLAYATTLMPLTTGNNYKDKKVQKKVWNYCVKHGLHYSARLQKLIYNNKRGT